MPDSISIHCWILRILWFIFFECYTLLNCDGAWRSLLSWEAKPKQRMKIICFKDDALPTEEAVDRIPLWSSRKLFDHNKFPGMSCDGFFTFATASKGIEPPEPRSHLIPQLIIPAFFQDDQSQHNDRCTHDDRRRFHQHHINRQRHQARLPDGADKNVEHIAFETAVALELRILRFNFFIDRFPETPRPHCFIEWNCSGV